MDRQAREAKEMVKNMPFRERVKHFWHYYRNHTIIGIAVFLIIGWGMVQCINQAKYDLNIAYYTAKGIEQEMVDAFADSLESIIEDIDGSGTTQIFMPMYWADINDQMQSEQTLGIIYKLTAGLATDEFQMYIVDQPFMDYFNRGYSDIIQSTLLLSDIPEVKEALGLDEGEKLYLIMTTEFEQSRDDEFKHKERKNAALVEEYFRELAK